MKHLGAAVFLLFSAASFSAGVNPMPPYAAPGIGSSGGVGTFTTITADSGYIKALNGAYTVNAAVYGDSSPGAQVGIQAMVDRACTIGGRVYIPGGKYLLTARVYANHCNGLGIVMSNNARIYWKGDSTWVPFPLGAGFPSSKAPIIIDSSDNAWAEGGVIDGKGLVHTFQTDADGILFKDGANNYVHHMRVININPNVAGVDTFSGFVDGGVAIRYNGILGFRARNFKAYNNTFNNIKYTGIRCSYQCRGVNFYSNTGTNMFEGLNAAYYGSGSGPLSDSGVIYSMNDMSLYRAQGLVSHSPNTIINTNYVHDCQPSGTSLPAEIAGIMFIDSSSGNMTGNTLLNASTTLANSRASIQFRSFKHGSAQGNYVSFSYANCAAHCNAIGIGYGPDADSNSYISIKENHIFKASGCFIMPNATFGSHVHIENNDCDNFTAFGVSTRAQSEDFVIKNNNFTTLDSVTTAVFSLNQGSAVPVLPTIIRGNTINVPANSLARRFTGIGSNTIIEGNDGFDTTTQNLVNANDTVYSRANLVRTTVTLSAARTLYLRAPTSVTPKCLDIMDAGMVNGVNTLTIQPLSGVTVNGSNSAISFLTAYSTMRICRTLSANAYTTVANE